MIVFCHLLNDNSGSPTILKSAIKSLVQHDQDAVLLVGSQGGEFLDDTGISISKYWYRRSHYRFVTFFYYVFSQFLLYHRLSRLNLSQDAILYVNTLLPFAAGIWGRVHRRRVIYHLHEVSLSPRLLQNFLTFVVRKCADHVIYVSNEHQLRLPISGVSKTIISNPVSTKIFECSKFHSYQYKKSGLFEVLMLASPRDFKGIPEFIMLAHRFVSFADDVVFVLVLNDIKPEIDRYLRRFDLPNNIRVHARTNNPAEFYSTADILLNLSRVDQWVETFGLTLIEAMAFGIPVIAPPIGGPSEIVNDGINGFLVNSQDIDKLETSLLKLIRNRALLMRLSSEALIRSRDFTLDRFAEKISDVVFSVQSYRS